MFSADDLIWGIAVPAVTAALAMALAWRPWCRDAPVAGGYWGGVAALSLSFALASLGILQRLPIPPREATHWLFVIAIGALPVGLIDALVPVPAWVRWLAACLWFAAFNWLLLRPLNLVNALSSTALVSWLVLLTFLAVIWWMWLDPFAERQRGPLIVVQLLVVAAAVAMVLMLSGSKLLGQLGGVVAAITGSCLAVSLLAKQVSLARGGVFTFVSLITGLLICGHFYADLSRLNGGLLLTAGLLTTAGNFVPSLAMLGWKRLAILILPVLVPAIAAVSIAAFEFAANKSPYGY
jgi:hypothetical protein